MTAINQIAARIKVTITRSWWSVVFLLLLSELIYLGLVRFDAVSTFRSVVVFVSMMALLFLFYWMAYLALKDKAKFRRKTMVLVVFGAILFRMTVLFAGIPPHTTLRDVPSRIRSDIRCEAVTFDSYLLFDNDIWRYLWDGHVGAAGINPYRFAPRSPELDQLTISPWGDTRWSDIRANVNHSDVPTIYPPLPQLLFRVSHMFAPGSVLAMKLLFVLCDLVTIFFISTTLIALNRPVTEVVLYAWNPLLIKVVAGSGHFDALPAMLLAATVYLLLRDRPLAAGIAWGMAALARLSPIVLLPFLVRRIGWPKSLVGVLVVAIGYVPYLDTAGASFAGLRVFAREWQFNSAFFTFIEWLASSFVSNPAVIARLSAAAAFVALMAWLVHKDRKENWGFALLSVTALGGLVILGPTVMPWYLVWLLPLSVVARSYVWLFFSFLVCLAFFVMVDGTERSWMLCIEYSVFALILWRKRLFGHKSAERRDHSPDTYSTVTM